MTKKRTKISEVVLRLRWAELDLMPEGPEPPVLTPAESMTHPHMAARGIYSERDGILQAAPAPRFSATPAGIPGTVPARGEHSAEILRSAGLDEGQIGRLLSST